MSGDAEEGGGEREPGAPARRPKAQKEWVTKWLGYIGEKSPAAWA